MLPQHRLRLGSRLTVKAACPRLVASPFGAVGQIHQCPESEIELQARLELATCPWDVARAQGRTTFIEELLGERCRTALQAQAQHLDLAPPTRLCQAQAVADADLARGLAGLAVDLDAVPLDGFDALAAFFAGFLR